MQLPPSQRRSHATNSTAPPPKHISEFAVSVINRPSFRSTFWRCGRASLLFLSTLRGLHLYVFSRHRVVDSDFVANLHVAVNFSVGVPVDLPAVFPFLHHDH